MKLRPFFVASCATMLFSVSAFADSKSAGGEWVLAEKGEQFRYWKHKSQANLKVTQTEIPKRWSKSNVDLDKVLSDFLLVRQKELSSVGIKNYQVQKYRLLRSHKTFSYELEGKYTSGLGGDVFFVERLDFGRSRILYTLMTLRRPTTPTSHLRRGLASFLKAKGRGK